MPRQQRQATKYPGVFFIEGTAKDGRIERIYYIRYRQGVKMVEEKAGRQFEHDMAYGWTIKKRSTGSGAPGRGPSQGRAGQTR